MWFIKITNQKSILIFILFLLFILFRINIWEWYDVNVITRFMSLIKTHWLIDICLISLSVLVFLKIIRYIIEKSRVTNTVFFLCTFFFLLFIYCRLFVDKYNYESFYWLPNLKYSDLLFSLFGFLILLKVWNWINVFQKPFYFNSPFLIDYPINKSKDDLYKRKDFAELLCKKMQSELKNNEAGALAIGINGAWGSGKTSFSNLVKEKIIHKNRIVIEFNPWRSSSHNKIIEDFFELLISELQKYNPGLSRTLTTYASTLTKIDENIISKSIATLSEYIFEPLNKNESYDKINAAIACLKKQIIIFVDDLDRLDMNEAIEVLRLIRNTANFNNVVYLVSYDKGYLLEAVKKFNPYNYRAFLEKIFQLEFLLPGFDNGILRNELKDILNDNITTKNDPILNAAIDYVGNSGKNITSRVLKNKRDILRFSNELLFEIEDIRDEVNFVDFYLIQLLKLKYTVVYKDLADHFESFFITENNKIRLRLVSEKGVSDDFLKSFHLFQDEKEIKTNSNEVTLFQEYINRNTSENYTEREKDIIIELIGELMKEKEYRISSTSKDYRSFVYAQNFNTYFNIKLLESTFTSKEFEQYRYTDYNGYRRVIFDQINNGRISDVLERLEKIVDFSSKEEWVIHWKILIEIAKFQYREGGIYGINYKGIINTLTYPVHGEQLRFFESNEDYVEYIKRLFNTAIDPYVIESSILYAALSTYTKLPLTPEELQDQLYDYFKKYCATHKEVTNEFRALHTNAVSVSNNFRGELNTSPQAQELFVSHFLSNMTSEQLNGFIKHVEGGTDLFKIDEQWVKTFFPISYPESLEEFLKTAVNIKKDKKFYDEFMNFFETFKLNNYKPIDFIFNYLKPSLWTSGTKTKTQN